MSGSDISTWSKAKDVLLVGLMGLMVLALGKLMVDVSEIKVKLAEYSADSRSLKENHDRLDVEFRNHLKEDREMFSRMGAKR